MSLLLALTQVCVEPHMRKSNMPLLTFETVPEQDNAFSVCNSCDPQGWGRSVKVCDLTQTILIELWNVEHFTICSFF